MNILIKMNRIKDLTPSERQVVNFILKDPKCMCNMGIVDIAKKTYTSTSTIIRVCKKLGMDSFIDFRIRLAADVNEYLESTILLKNQLPLEPQDTLENIVDKITNNNMRAVLDVKRLNKLSVFERVIDMIGKCKQIDFYGNGVSNLICQDAMLKAMRLGIASTSYSFYTEMSMLAKTSDSTHLAFIISYTGKNRDTIKIAELLQQSNVPSVSITSHTENDLLELCDVNLFVDNYESIYRVGGMSSRIGLQHVLDIVFSGYMNANYEKIEKIVGKTFDNEPFIV